MSILTNRRPLAAAGIVLLAASGIAACSDTGPIAPTGQPPATTEPPTTEPPTTEPPSTEPPTTEPPSTEPPTTEPPTTEPPAPPSGDGVVNVSGDLSGTLPSDGVVTITLEVTERAAVAIGATSPDGGDLGLYLTGNGVDMGIDDSFGYADVFSFDQANLDPAITHVLEPGTYSMDVSEWTGTPAQYQLEILSGTEVIQAGGTTIVEVTDASATLFIVELATGNETIATNGEIDSMLWAFIPSSHTAYEDDDGGDGLNSMITLPGESVEPIVVAVAGWAGRTGTTTLGIS